MFSAESEGICAPVGVDAVGMAKAGRMSEFGVMPSMGDSEMSVAGKSASGRNIGANADAYVNTNMPDAFSRTLGWSKAQRGRISNHTNISTHTHLRLHTILTSLDHQLNRRSKSHLARILRF